MTGRHRTLVAVAGVVVVAIVFAAIGIAVGRRVRSPAQAAVDAAPPPASPVTAPVQRRLLSQQVVTRGRIVVDEGEGIDLPIGVVSVVTAAPLQKGEALTEGVVAAELGGRPVIVLQGAFPSYRDLIGGCEGPDVRQLQEALNRLGASVEVDGLFGPETQSALTAAYHDRGYEPRPGAEPETVEAAGDAYTAAKLALASAQRRLDDAEEALAAAQAADQPTRSLEEEVEEAQAQVTLASRQRSRAWRELSDARLRAGPSLPRSEVLFLSDLPRTVQAVRFGVGDDIATLDGPAFVLSVGTVRIVAELSGSAAGLVAVGDEATGVDDVSGDEVKLQVERIDRSETGVTVSMLVVEGDLARNVQRSLRVTLRGVSTPGPVLAVPVTAIYSHPDGTRYVTVIDQAGRRDVGVAAGLSVDGMVEITPEEGALAAGDQVLVGYELGAGDDAG